MPGPTKTCYELRVTSHQDRRDGAQAAHDFYLEVALVNTQGKEVQTIKSDNRPSEDRIFEFSSSDTSDVLQIRNKIKRKFLPDRRVGCLSVSILSLLEMCACGEAKQSLDSPPKKGLPSTAGEITVYLKDVDSEKRAGIDLENVRQAIQRLAVSAGKEDHAVSRMAELVRKLDEVVKAVEGAAKVNSYLNLAWQSLTVMYRIVSHQFRKDQKAIDLVQLMKETLSFAADAKTLADKTNKIKEGYKAVLQLTLDCCQFIQEYTGRSFAGRAIRLDDHMISDYASRFKSVKDQIDSNMELHIAKGINYIASKQLLQDLKERLSPIKSDDTSKLPRCLPGTRVRYLEEIKGWLFGSTSENILWFHGIAGAGKSTIAATIMDDCDKDYCNRDHCGKDGCDKNHDRKPCLAALLFFRRGSDDSGSIIRSIAYQLATFHPTVAEHVAAHVEAHANARGANLSEQFKQLLLEPFEKSKDVLDGPLIIILDALDECGSESQRREILELLKLEFHRLPLTLRFLVTSRPENDIMKSLSSQAHIRELVLDHDLHDSHQDVFEYIQDSLQSIREDALDGQAVRSIATDLSETASGLFIWASTAMKMVRDTDDPRRELKALTSDMRSGEVGEHGIDNLYKTVLEESGINWKKADSKDRFTGLLGLSFFGKEWTLVRTSLSVEEMECFLGLKVGTAKETLGRLRSVLSYEGEKDGKSIRLHHASFFDYLTSRDRSGDQPWHIDEISQKHAIAERCFDVMEKGLRFNICKLGLPFVRNEDIPDLEERIKKNIPRHLEYTCRFWAAHICDLPASGDKTTLLDKLRSFTHERLLYCFEVLSLTKHFKTVKNTLENASDWIKTIDADVASFLQEAYRLADTFGYAISQSMPHLYLSALSLSKFDNRVAEHYSKMHPTVPISVREARDSGSGPRRETPDYQSTPVLSVSISPDGKWIASASGSTVSVWDVNSGELHVALTGHRREVNSVVFFPDGRRIVSGSLDGTVRIWDIDTEKHVEFSSDLDPVWFVTVSADGKVAASAHLKGMVHIRNADTGKTVETYETHNIWNASPIAISPNGTHIASCYRQTMVRVRNVDSGTFVADPFRGHINTVTSLAFSPDGRRVVSAALDRTLRMWDAFNGNLVAGPFLGHADWVNSIVFSPDGKYVASGSDDRSIIIWDAETAQLIKGPFYGHANDITSVAWSSDGTRIASGSRSGTIRIWAANKLLASQDAIDKRREDVRSPRISVSNTASLGAALDQPSLSIHSAIVDWTLSEDGWVLGERGELLLWLPWSIRRGLWLPETIAVIGVEYETRLDFTNYPDVLGKTWQRLPDHQAAHAHDEFSTVSLRRPPDNANNEQQENFAIVSIIARSTPNNILNEHRRERWIGARFGLHRPVQSPSIRPRIRSSSQSR